MVKSSDSTYATYRTIDGGDNMLMLHHMWWNRGHCVHVNMEHTYVQICTVCMCMSTKDMCKHICTHTHNTYTIHTSYPPTHTFHTHMHIHMHTHTSALRMQRRPHTTVHMYMPSLYIQNIIFPPTDFVNDFRFLNIKNIEK